ncbi:hypothetical protein Mapa_017808 [Marchantia paleacea]|nr:hypothetical protein Mapa_017808 [Marchantia paleacea]
MKLPTVRIRRRKGPPRKHKALRLFPVSSVPLPSLPLSDHELSLPYCMYSALRLIVAWASPALPCNHGVHVCGQVVLPVPTAIGRESEVKQL